MNTKEKDFKETYWNKVLLLDYIFLFFLKINREKIIRMFFNNIEYSNSKSILDVGTTPDTSDYHNVLLHNTKMNKDITCLSNLDCSSLKKKFKNLKKTIIGDGRNINFKNNEFDIVHSSATLEHVGSFLDQCDFVNECCRVSKEYVFITTPNRNYPIDFHTKLPFLHLLPKKIHRKILNFLGFKFFSLEKNLNLLSINDLVNICKKNKIKNFKILKNKFFFFTSNLILIIKTKK